MALTLLKDGMWYEPEAATHDIALALDHFAAARVEAERERCFKWALALLRRISAAISLKRRATQSALTECNAAYAREVARSSELRAEQMTEIHALESELAESRAECARLKADLLATRTTITPCDLQRSNELAEKYGWVRSPTATGEDYIDIVFDGPPSHKSGQFVEVENPAGRSIRFGEWVRRPDGYWVLRFQSPTAAHARGVREGIEKAAKRHDAWAAKAALRANDAQHRGNLLQHGFELTEVRAHEASAADLRADARTLATPETTQEEKHDG